MKEVSKSFGKGLLWTCFTMIFGLLQLWIVLANGAVITSYNVDFNKIVLDGTLLFFTSAVVASICTDYYLGNKCKLNKIASSIIYFVYPVIVLICCIWLFSLNFSEHKNNLDLAQITNIQITIIVMTIIYAITTKAIIFFQEDY
ncbi:hypothetical protein [Shewanella aegiceratis]|uniref:hypothetical protein n=1 Tax=Shewanella aegiceratis TaxID=2864203 RepID=UPI001C65ED17|nr:hypothetical protein [Shewanella aegiceratis]QYJ81808.1 hypothetical protein K0H80_16130 [Shewanella aegiceratis]